jgi:hypothetical protein
MRVLTLSLASSPSYLHQALHSTPYFSSLFSPRAHAGRFAVPSGDGLDCEARNRADGFGEGVLQFCLEIFGVRSGVFLSFSFHHLFLPSPFYPHALSQMPVTYVFEELQHCLTGLTHVNKESVEFGKRLQGSTFVDMVSASEVASHLFRKFVAWTIMNCVIAMGEVNCIRLCWKRGRRLIVDNQ